MIKFSTKLSKRRRLRCFRLHKMRQNVFMAELESLQQSHRPLAGLQKQRRWKKEGNCLQPMRVIEGAG